MDNEAKIREMQALITLVDEPDQKVYEEISEKIRAFGPQVIPFLEHAWENNLEANVQGRIENIIHAIQFEVVTRDFSQWLKGGGVDLLEGWIILTRYQYPALNEEDLHFEINQIRKDIWLEINDNLTALEQVKVFNHVFYHIHGFKGDAENYHAPENSFLNRVLKSRKGNPLSLGIIYLLLAQSLDLPVFGVNLPEHFVLAYTSNTFNPQTLMMDKQQVLFYINAFSSGIIFTRQDVEDFLKHLNVEPSPSYFEPCNNQEIIRRMINNLIISFQKVEALEKAKEMIVLRSLME